MSENRFYENEFPEPGESVIVKVLRLETTMGAYVALLEYGRMEGLILPNELSKRRFRSIHKLIKVGRQEVVSVVRVDADKGYVDLSKKRVAPEDIAATEQRFSNAKKVQLTVRQVASKLDMPILDLNKKAIWPLYRKFNHAYDGLKMAASGDEATVARVFDGISEETGGTCSKEIIEAILEDIRPRFAPQAIKARVRIHCACTGIQGVNAVKTALLNAEAQANVSAAEGETLSPAAESFSLKIQLVASPLYTLIASSADKAYGLAKVQEALESIKNTLTAVPGGEFRQHGEILIFGADDEEPEKDEDQDDDGDDDSSGASSSSDSDDESSGEESAEHK